MGLSAEALLPFIFGGSGSRSGSDVLPLIGEIGTVTLGTTWDGDDPYTSTVTVDGATVTDTTIVHILSDTDAITQMRSDGITEIYISNNNGVLTATAVGGVLTSELTLNVLCSGSSTVQQLCPAGGTTNQVLTKMSDDDYDYDWADLPVWDGGVVNG